MNDPKQIAERIRSIVNSRTCSRDLIFGAFVDLANELDSPEARPVLAGAKVGWVCRRRDGKWVQLTKTDRNVIHDGESYPYEYVLGVAWFVNVNGYWNISSGTHPADIVSCEPLAPEGTAEWALQQMKLGYKVTKGHLSRTYWHYDARPHLKCISEYNCGTLQIMVLPGIWLTTAEPTGYQLYEPEPEPKPEPPREPEYVICKCCAGSQSVPNPEVSNTAYTTCPKCGGTGYEIKPEPAKEQFEVGDWVEHNSGSHHKVLQISKDGRRFRISNYEFPWFENDGWEEPDGRTRNSRIVRKLSPSEVKVRITLEGTVHKIDGNNLAFELEDEKGVVTVIGYQQLDPNTAKLVRELVGKEADK